MRPLLSRLLAEDLKRIGYHPSAAAKKVGLSHKAVLSWVHGKRTPRTPDILSRLITGLGLDPARYERFLAPTDVVLVCPMCGRLRTLPKCRLRIEERRRGGPFHQRPEGSYERNCKRCSAQESGQRQIGRLTKLMLERRLGKQDAEDLIDWAKDPQDKEEQNRLRKERLAMLGGQRTLAANQEKFRRWVRRPMDEKLLRLKSRVRVGMVRLKKPFYLCPLCELISWGNRWHKPCLHTWLRHRKRKLAPGWSRTLPPASRPMGRDPRLEKHLMRNYTWLIARRMGQTRRELLSGNLSTKTKGTVTKAIRAFIALLPGSWDWVFRRPRNTRRANRTRQELVSLPLELQSIITAGGRDPLIKRLGSFGMSAESIAQVTGADLLRVQMVIGPRKEVDQPRPSWLVRVINARLRACFIRCPVCGLVLYDTRCTSRRCFHGPCFRVLRRSRQMSARDERSLDRLLATPIGEAQPQRERQRLLQGYQSLLRWAGENPQGANRGPLSRGARAFLELLPASWAHVFRDPNLNRANQLRQDVFPLPAHRGDRAEVAQRLHRMGMPAADIAELTGIPSRQMKTLGRDRGKPDPTNGRSLGIATWERSARSRSYRG